MSRGWNRRYRRCWFYIDVERKPQILKRRAQRHVGEVFLYDACDRVLDPRHDDDTFRCGVCLRGRRGVKMDFHAVFARVYYAAPIVLEAERAGNNSVRTIDLCFAAFEISIKVPLADVPLEGSVGGVVMTVLVSCKSSP